MLIGPSNGLIAPDGAGHTIRGAGKFTSTPTRFTASLPVPMELIAMNVLTPAGRVGFVDSVIRMPIRAAPPRTLRQVTSASNPVPADESNSEKWPRTLPPPTSLTATHCQRWVVPATVPEPWDSHEPWAAPASVGMDRAESNATPMHRFILMVTSLSRCTAAARNHPSSLLSQLAAENG